MDFLQNPHVWSRFLHLLGAVLWMGAAWSIAGDAKRALQNAENGGELLLGRLGRNVWLVTFGMILAMATGAWLIMLGGGMKAYPFKSDVDPSLSKWHIHISMSLVLLAFVLQLILVLPAWGKVKAGVEAGGEEARQALGKAKLMAAGTGVGQLIWTVVLLLMLASIYGTK
ncbi:MAG: hypothetical protein AAF368_16250 [Planctomycetota bacterium]